MEETADMMDDVLHLELLTEHGADLMDLQDLELASKAHEIMLEAVEAAQNSASKFRKLQQRASHLQKSSELGSISHYTMGNNKKRTPIKDKLFY
jgi:hypothetical protein